MGEWQDDVYLGDVNLKVSELASLSNENWSAKGKTDNAILKNYLRFTYKKLCEENKIITTPAHSIFNTGLFTEYGSNDVLSDDGTTSCY